MPRRKPRAVVDIKSLARQYTQQCIDTLVAVMQAPKGPMASRVAAAQCLLDRGWGRPAQVVTGDESGVPISVIHRVIVSIDKPDANVINELDTPPKCIGTLAGLEVLAPAQTDEADD